MKFLVGVLILVQIITDVSPFKDTGCFEKWLQGYRLATGHPQRTLTSVTLERCQIECERERGCAGLAFGVSGVANGTCELAIRTLRDSRSVGNLTSLPYDEITKAPQYDIYLMGSNCVQPQRQPLFSSSALQHPGPGNGVPIDCFYRLMSGKRLAKNHVFRAISVGGLQECQEACVDDGNCRSISYRYMVSGYTYNVANCELSPFYVVNYEETARLKYDFVDDYDYDYFQREPHCKTTSRLGSFGVCAVIVRQGAKLAPNLVKSVHQTSTATQCEFLCQTASRFRCRAFSLRHTTRGRDPFHRDASYESVCTLYEVDISRLSQYDIVHDPDYDLYELGRLMGAECILYDQYLNRRPSTTEGFKHSHYTPIVEPPWRDREPDRTRERYPAPAPILPPVVHRPLYDDRAGYDYHSRRPGSHYLPETKVVDDVYHRPGSSLSSGSSGYRPTTPGSSFETGSYRPLLTPSSSDLPYYDPRREACLVKVKQDFYLDPEASRASFPTKGLEECRIECLRALEVLRFPCRVLSYRLTSSSGGSCQLSEYYEQDLRSSDFIPARDRYEHAVVYKFDETDVLCRRSETRYGGVGGVGVGAGHHQQYEGRYGSSGYDRDRRPPYEYRPGVAYPHERERERPVFDAGRHRDYGRYPDDRYGSGYVGSTTVYGKGYVGATQPFRPYLPPPPERDYDRPRDALQTQTVNGEKCLRACTQDKEAGFHYCVVDTRGTWDFCCRPDHFCGYSRGLSVPWCYVGNGPTAQVWRSCNHRLLSTSANPPVIAYLHEAPPPKVHSLSTSDVANLSKDNALKLLTSAAPTVTGINPDFENIDGDEGVTESMVKASSNLNSTQVYFGNGIKNGPGKNVTIGNSGEQVREGRRISRKPTFSVVEVRSSNVNAEKKTDTE